MFSGAAPVVELRYDPSKSMEMQAVQGSIMQVAMQTVSQSAFAPGADYTSQMGGIEGSERLTPAQKASYRDFLRHPQNGQRHERDRDRERRRHEAALRP